MEPQETTTPGTDELRRLAEAMSVVSGSDRGVIGHLLQLSKEGEGETMLIMTYAPSALRIPASLITRTDEIGIHLSIPSHEALAMLAGGDDVLVTVVDVNGHTIGAITVDEMGLDEDLIFRAGDQRYRVGTKHVNRITFHLNVAADQILVVTADLSGLVVGMEVLDFEGLLIGTVERTVDDTQFVLAWPMGSLVVSLGMVGHVDYSATGKVYLTEEASTHLAAIVAEDKDEHRHAVDQPWH